MIDQLLWATARPFADPCPRRAGRGGEYQPHSELSEVSAVAKAAGIYAGMTVAQARALIPDLVVMHPSAAAEQAALDALADGVVLEFEELPVGIVNFCEQVGIAGLLVAEGDGAARTGRG